MGSENSTMRIAPDTISFSSMTDAIESLDAVFAHSSDCTADGVVTAQFPSHESPPLRGYL
jgi:hypothetical protein